MTNKFPKNFEGDFSDQRHPIPNENEPSGRVSPKDMGDHANNSTLKELSMNNLQSLEYEVYNQYLNNYDKWVFTLISRCIESIKVVGFNMLQIPAITALPIFMNESSYLKQRGHIFDANELEFQVGTLMLSSKRFTQATEIFRRVQNYYLR